MTMRAQPLPISIGLATGALALGYALGSLWIWTLFIIALGGLWLLGQWRNWDCMASMGLVFCVGMAAVGLWLDLAAGWMLFGTVAALIAWDLDHFAQRLRNVRRIETPAERRRELERRHLQWLLIVDGLGLLLGAVALGLKITFSFGVALLLGLLAVLGLSRAVGFLRHESD